MLAYRYWRVGWRVDGGRPVLYSLVVGEPWPEAVKAADAVPVEWGGRGIHAYVEGTELPAEGARDGAEVLVLGAIDAHGRVVEHANGVIRAEYARILALRVVDAPGRFSAAPCRFCTLGYGVHQVEYWDDRYDKQRAAGHFVFPLVELREIEDLLLRTYGVPRLPDGAGPWRAGAES